MARFNVIMATVIDGLIKAFGEVVRRTSRPPSRGAEFHSVHRWRADGKLWNYNDTAHGGWGASRHGDGSGPFKTMSHGDCKDIPVEIVEALYPIRIDELSLRADSGWRRSCARRAGHGTALHCA